MLGGYHHEWGPGVHTLLLVSRLQDTFQVADPKQPVLLLAKNAAGAFTHTAEPTAAMNYRSEFEAYSTELQQIWQRETHSLIAGVRYQNGGFDTRSTLGASTATKLSNKAGPPTAVAFASKPVNQDFSSDLERVSVYAYDHWRLADPLLLIGGVSYDYLTFPLNHRSSPILNQEETNDQVSPKAGLVWTLSKNSALRGSYTRSLGGVSYDQSFRLEPTQIAGFTQAYRSLISESVAGAAASPTFETWGLALDHKLGSGTYFGIETELLKSEVDRRLGSIELSDFVIFPVPDAKNTASSTRQHLDYQEKNLVLTLNQLVGDQWSVGMRYRVSEADLNTSFPDIPDAVSGGSNIDTVAALQQLNLYTRFNHPSGFFGLFESLWSKQSNRGYSTDLPGDDFWHFNIYAGYRFVQRADRAAELKLGLLNLTDQDYQLNPLNLYNELYRDRTFTVSFKFYF